MTFYNLRIIPLLLILLQSAAAFSQTPDDYTAGPEESKYLSSLQSQVKKKYLDDSSRITGENKKYINRFYRARFDEIDQMFADSLIVVNRQANEYLNKLAAEIIKSNPELSNINFRFLLYRAFWPNASAYGEGTVIFNLDLFTRLHNESQIAAILCHEMAHQYLEHWQNRMMRYVNTVYSDDFQKELKQIKKSSYEQNKKLDELEKSIAFKSRRHSREFETQSDSLGLVFLQRTRFDTRECLTVLALLDSIDGRQLNMESILRKQFNFAGYPFKESWIQKKSAFFNATVENTKSEFADSLKTHPDCQQRIRLLEPKIMLQPKYGSASPVDAAEFARLKPVLVKETIETLFRKKYISQCLFYTLEYLELDPTDPYLLSTAGACLAELYTHQKAHTLNTITDLPSPFINADYNTLLKFIEALRLEDLRLIADNFLTEKAATAGNLPRHRDALKIVETNNK